VVIGIAAMDVEEYNDQSAMRSHFIQCLQTGNVLSSRDGRETWMAETETRPRH